MMELVEIIVQASGAAAQKTLQKSANGVSNATAPIKIPLKPGINFIQTASRDAAELLHEIILSLLYLPTTVVQGLLNSPQEKVRGGLTLKQGDDIFRLVKDFNARSISLSQYKKETNQFGELSRDDKFIFQLLQTRHKLPTPSLYRNLFCIGGERYNKMIDQLNSKVGAQSPSSAEYFGVLEKPSGNETQQKQERLNLLKKQVGMLEQVQSLETSLDEVQQKIFDKEEVIRRCKDKEKEMQSVEAQFRDSLQGVQNVAIPDDIKVKIDKYLKAEKDRITDLDKLEGKAEKLTIDFSNTPIQPIHKNVLLIGGVVGFLITSIAALRMPNIRLYLVFGVLSCIGTVGFSFIQQLARQEKHRKLKLQIDQLDHEKKSIEKKYEIEMSVISHLMKRLQIKDPKDILELVHEREQASTMLRKTKDEIDNLRRTLNVEQVEKDLQNLQMESAEIRRKMEKFTGVNFDPMSIRREIEELEIALGLAPSSNLSNSGSIIDPLQDPLLKFLQDASQLLKINAKDLLVKIKPGLETNMVAVSNRALAEPHYNNDRILGFSTGKGGKLLPISDFNEQQLFYAFFALHFTLLQMLTKNGFQLPVLLLDLPDAANDNLDVIHKAFKHLSGNTQVVCVMENRQFTSLQKPDLTL